ncbi:MAG TPA: CpsD/CapB family tyrosine-protein kinase [Steroidobacteraceae bacterium]|nr:CpsD/CapB family tyrosine-protein kinase [Steroidobacteraceae bacterium]
MSLIEEAIRKATLERAAGRGNLAMQPRVARPVPSTAAAEAAARQFALAPPDPETMERHHVLPALSDVAVSRAYKILRTRVLQRMRAKGWHSLGVTGTAAGEGKSLTAINLALALAQDVNTWVFLVDLDLQRPQVGVYLGMRYERGLTDYLTGHAESDQIIYDTGIKRLAVIPNAHPVEQSSEYLSSPRMIELMNALDAETPRRIVVFDMPPLLVSDDVLAFAPRLDSLLFVVSQGQTARRTIANAREILAEMNLIGVVLNRSTERNDSPYY